MSERRGPPARAAPPRLERGLGGWWEGVVSGRERGIGATLARLLLSGVAPLFGLGARANLALYETGLCRRKTAGCPVISVGNLTVGGTGKTTVAAYLARRLQEEGRRVAIVSRGHGRRAGEPRIITDPARAVVAEVGDEPLMLARRLPGCAVGVGKWRERVIEQLLRAGLADVVILDDGAQYFRLARDVELLLVDALDDLAKQRLFPRGRLREPLRHLRRADAIIVTHADLAPAGRIADIAELIGRLAPEAVLLECRHRPTRLRRLGAEEVEPPDELAGGRVLAFSGLGRPEAFAGTLASLGADVVGVAFDDHHFYTEDDVVALRSRAESADCREIVTTAKDAVRLEGLPGSEGFRVLECELELLSGEEDLDRIMARAAQPGKGHQS